MIEKENQSLVVLLSVVGISILALAMGFWARLLLALAVAFTYIQLLRSGLKVLREILRFEAVRRAYRNQA